MTDIDRPSSSPTACQGSTVFHHATSRITFPERWRHVLARWGYRRSRHRVEPGLYALGHPTSESPVFVTANYALSFDALRVALKGVDSYVLVLDTKGVNVWCAAGKGTFGTEELLQRIESTRLCDVVSHRELVLPQLGASGVSAHAVRQRSGFRVEYGPVRASDLPPYLESRTATPEMRRVRFTLRDRVALIPVELVHVCVLTLAVAAVFYLIAGSLPAAAAVTSLLTGVVLFPLLLPVIPTANFSTKGFLLGVVAGAPFAVIAFWQAHSMPVWLRFLRAFPYVPVVSAVTAFLCLNFTGSTTFTSRSGVKTEIFRYVPVMAVLFGSGVLGSIAFHILRTLGG